MKTKAEYFFAFELLVDAFAPGFIFLIKWFIFQKR